MKILIETIPHSEQRYDTVGDWFQAADALPGCSNIEDDSDLLVIRVSQMSDWRYEALVAVHELIEALLCKQAGITAERVDAFDLSFKGPGEPGDSADSPYFVQHHFASVYEGALASQLGVNWKAYEKEIDSL